MDEDKGNLADGDDLKHLDAFGREQAFSDHDEVFLSPVDGRLNRLAVQSLSTDTGKAFPWSNISIQDTKHLNFF